jgi:hypothetical protein
MLRPSMKLNVHADSIQFLPADLLVLVLRSLGVACFESTVEERFSTKV